MHLRTSTVGVAALCVSFLLIAGCARSTTAKVNSNIVDTRYISVTLRGTITSKAGPVAGAEVEFTSTATDGMARKATTDQNGEFTLEGLRYENYVMRIITADDRELKGVNTFSMVEGESAAVELKISDRLVTEVNMTNQPDGFIIAVEKKPLSWNRFWTELGIFFGVAIGAGAAAL